VNKGILIGFVFVFAMAGVWQIPLLAGPSQQDLLPDKKIQQEGSSDQGTVSQPGAPGRCPEGQVWSAREHECVPAGGGLVVPEPQSSGGGGVAPKGTEEKHAGDGIVGEVGE